MSRVIQFYIETNDEYQHEKKKCPNLNSNHLKTFYKYVYSLLKGENCYETH